MTAKVRLARAADRDRVVECAVAAFVTEPAFEFFFGDQYAQYAPSFLRFLFDLRLATGEVWVGEEAGVLASVAMFNVPATAGASHSWETTHWSEVASTFPDDVNRRLDAYEEALAGHKPADDHYYLGVIATHPERQGRGLASAVLAPALSAADLAGLATYLETGTKANVPFYERRGFVVDAELALPGGSPVWWMRRPAPGG